MHWLAQFIQVVYDYHTVSPTQQMGSLSGLAKWWLPRYMCAKLNNYGGTLSLLILYSWDDGSKRAINTGYL